MTIATTTAITQEEGLEATMRDGTVLRADAWRPAVPGRYPVLLIRVPYDKTQAEDLCYAHPSWFARRGYAVVVQDMRGRWRSEGEFVPFESAEDTEDTIAWAAELPFSNGSVGMYGFSYPGAVQLQAAVRQAEGLRAICPAMTSPDYYEGWAYNHGAFALAFNASWATFLAEDVARRRGDAALESQLGAQYSAIPDLVWILPVTAIPNLGRGQVGEFYQDWVEHEAKDEFWRRWDVTDRLPEVDIPAFCVAGLYDVFLEGTLAAYQGIRRGPAQKGAHLLVGPWWHMPWMPAFGALDFGPEARNRVSDLHLAFFDQWLRDGDEMERPRVRAFLTGANRWEELVDWPPPATDWPLHLRATSRANSISGDGYLSEEHPGAEDPDMFTYDPIAPVPSRGGRSCCLDFVAPMGPADQRPVESWNSVLVYTSPMLEHDRVVMGTIRAHLFAATSALDTDWTVKVCDVHPDGRSINIQETIQRARFAGGTDRSRPIPPGEVSEFRMEVGSVAHVFEAGHSVRVEVSSSNFPHWDRNLNTGSPIGTDTVSDRIVATQTVLHDADHPSRVVLPWIE